jgi:hypothetical protein
VRIVDTNTVIVNSFIFKLLMPAVIADISNNAPKGSIPAIPSPIAVKIALIIHYIIQGQV